jgi:sporulation protein YlmC with PRC-barrel domain
MAETFDSSDRNPQSKLATRQLRLEQLIGKCVVDLAGARVGRIEEVVGECQGDDWEIVAYLVGAAALAERLSAVKIAAKLLGFFGARERTEGYRIPWDKLDLTDPTQPRLTCTIAELNQNQLQLTAAPEHE